MNRKPGKHPPGIPDRIPITDCLDLHGFFPEQVEEMVEVFLDNARRLGLNRLKIVHGKGRSRLKWEVRKVLERHPLVSDFGDAPPDSGGWGATLILLTDRSPGTQNEQDPHLS
ncbi:MAG TPA: DNA mismatch repair protein MutS [bacterium]|nr:DNA mismatch repair protein MutS [bacterium]